mmetsp:Transcript_324/g.193  ORF Transcript_324/g.193 Transcript_324/m.193 type:complete len:88 (+) Transcript_324:947-1210(+)
MKRKLKMMGERSLIIMVVTGIALLVPNFTDFLNIAGSLGSTMIVFVLPPILYMKAFWTDLSKLHIAFLIFIIVFGIGGGVYSIITSI